VVGCKGPRGVLATMVVALLASTAASSVYAGPVYFVVGERQFKGSRFDSYVLPLTEAADIAHARDLIARGPDAAGEPIAFASVVGGADGINRNVVARGEPLWHWHVSQFEGFGDFGIELIDGSPTTVENDVQGWIRNTTRDDPQYRPGRFLELHRHRGADRTTDCRPAARRSRDGCGRTHRAVHR